MTRILIAIATELDGHAGASAVQAAVSSFTKENIRNAIIEALTEGSDEAIAETVITHIHKEKEVYHVYGAIWGMDFSACAAPIKYTYIETRTG